MLNFRLYELARACVHLDRNANTRPRLLMIFPPVSSSISQPSSGLVRMSLYGLISFSSRTLPEECFPAHSLLERLRIQSSSDAAEKSLNGCVGTSRMQATSRSMMQPITVRRHCLTGSMMSMICLASGSPIAL